MLNRLAEPPYSLGQVDARSQYGPCHSALCWAVWYEHVAVLDRLAAPPYNLGPADAESAALCVATIGDAVRNRLAAPPYNLIRRGSDDNRG